MFVIPDLKLNSFQQESIPRPSELFSRFGFATKKGNFSGDDTPPVLSKVEQAAEAEKLIVDKSSK